MFIRFLICLGLLAFWGLAGGVERGRADSPPALATAQQARHAVERGLKFIQDDAALWRKEHECATCHHGAMTVWVLSEARSEGYEVADDVFSDTVKWSMDRFLERIDLPRDERPGWSMVSTPALYMSLMAQRVPKQDAISADTLKRFASHIVRHQEVDGSWGWSSAPATNRPPPVFESDEVATLLGYLALRPHVPADSKEKSDVQVAREKAAAWLAETKPTDTTQAAALRLLNKVWNGDPAVVLQAEIEKFLARQNEDGGWGQLHDLPSDAYATGQALYVLSFAGVKNDRPEVQRGVAFLVSSQRENGSWPMASHAHLGADPCENPVPITYFGSAWGMLALLRSASR